MPDLPLPSRFVGGELLGRGPGTEVYRAHDQVLDRPVAVKMFAPDADRLTRQRLDREGRALARLTHPGLVTIYDSGHHGSRSYLVMQLILGRTLQARLLEGPLSVPAMLELAVRLTDALIHVHDQGIVHRDIKPANIFLDEAGQPFLGDFGIALLAGATRLTSYDEIIGTPAYLAPEQVRGAGVEAATDIYALGLVLIECLTGEVEYAAESKAEAALARLSRAPRIPAGLSPGLTDLLRTMTDDQPGRRPTARACATELAALATADTRALSQPAATLLLPLAEHRRGLVVAGVCVTAAAVAGVLTLTHPEAPTTGTAIPSSLIAPTSVTPVVPSPTPTMPVSPAGPPTADTGHGNPEADRPGTPAGPPPPPAHPAPGKSGQKVPPGHAGDNPGKHKPKG